jgi:hypothetical protein
VTEKQLQAAVVECAKVLGWHVYHTYDSRRSEPGFPDLCMVRDGRLIFAELKTLAGKMSPEQARWFCEIRAAGIEAHLWRPISWRNGTVERVLRGEHVKREAA